MFIYQAQLAFEIWHKIKPKIDDKVIKLFESNNLNVDSGNFAFNSSALLLDLIPWITTN